MADDASTVLAFSNAYGDAYFIDDKVRFTLTPIALLYYQELARRAARMDGLYFLEHVKSLNPDQAVDEYVRSVPSFNPAMRIASGSEGFGLYDQMINFALVRESLDGLVGPFFTILFGRAMAGDVLRVQLGLQLARALAKRQVPISGPLGVLVIDCAHGEYHFKTGDELDRLERNLVIITKIREKQIKESLPNIPSWGQSSIDSPLGDNLSGEDDLWGGEWSLSDFEQVLSGASGSEPGTGIAGGGEILTSSSGTGSETSAISPSGGSSPDQIGGCLTGLLGSNPLRKVLGALSEAGVIQVKHLPGGG